MVSSSGGQGKRLTNEPAKCWPCASRDGVYVIPAAGGGQLMLLPHGLSGTAYDNLIPGNSSEHGGWTATFRTCRWRASTEIHLHYPPLLYRHVQCAAAHKSGVR